MSIVKDVPKETRKFVAKTIVSLLISILVLISTYLNFNLFTGIVGKIVVCVFIPLGWFILYPLPLHWYFNIIEQNPPKLIMKWIVFIERTFQRTFPRLLLSSLATISIMSSGYFMTGMIISLKNTFDPKMILSCISLFILTITLCFVVVSNHYSKFEKNPPKTIQIYRQIISDHTFTIIIVYFFIITISCSFIFDMLSRLILIIFR